MNSLLTAEDLYLYAMRLVSAEEAARIDGLLLQSPEARNELALVRSDVALLALSAEQHTPPALTRQRLLKQVAREPRALPEPKPIFGGAPLHGASLGNQFSDLSLSQASFNGTGMPAHDTSSFLAPDLNFRSILSDDAEPKRRSFAPLLPWVGWAMAAGMAVSTWNFYRHDRMMQTEAAFAEARANRSVSAAAKAESVLEALNSTSAQRFQLTKTNAAPIPSARVTYLAENGSLIFQANSLDALPPSKAYELWLIPAGAGSSPIPAGTFKPDAKGFATVLLPELPKGIVAGTFGVTIEEDGGARTPTLPILMIGS